MAKSNRLFTEVTRRTGRGEEGVVAVDKDERHSLTHT